MFPASPRCFKRFSFLHFVRVSPQRLMSAEVVLERVKEAGVITLNRPKQLNALTSPMIRQIYPQLQRWQSDSDVSLVIIRGAGERAFCAGGDIKVVTEAGKRGDKTANSFFREEYTLNNAIAECRVPYVALIDGVTMGGGVGLSVHGKFRVATERTLFAMPETAIGLFPDVGGSFFLPRLPGHMGRYLALTGQRLRGGELVQARIATHLVPSNQLSTLVDALVSLRRPSITDVDATIRQFQSEVSSKPLPWQGDVERLFTAATLRDLLSQLEADGSTWAREQLTTLRKVSPTSLALTDLMLKRGKALTLRQCFQMELRAATRCLQGHDFYEGVRAVLLDRDNKPQWKPDSLDKVNQADIERMLDPLPPGEDLQL